MSVRPQTPNRSDTGERDLVRCCGCCDTYGWDRPDRRGALWRSRAAPSCFFPRFPQASLVWRVSASSPMASPATDAGSSHQHHPVTESAADSALQEAQKWIEVSTNTDHSLIPNPRLTLLSYYLYLILSILFVCLFFLLRHLLKGEKTAKTAPTQILTQNVRVQLLPKFIWWCSVLTTASVRIFLHIREHENIQRRRVGN